MTCDNCGNKNICKYAHQCGLIQDRVIEVAKEISPSEPFKVELKCEYWKTNVQAREYQGLLK